MYEGLALGGSPRQVGGCTSRPESSSVLRRGRTRGPGMPHRSQAVTPGRGMQLDGVRNAVTARAEDLVRVMLQDSLAHVKVMLEYRPSHVRYGVVDHE